MSSTSNSRVSTVDPSVRLQQQSKAVVAGKKLCNSSAVRQERRFFARSKPNSAVRRNWKAAVKRVNDDRAGRSLPKEPTPSPTKLPRSKTISWGRFEVNNLNLPPQPSLPNPPMKPPAKKSSARTAKEFGRRHDSLMAKLGFERCDPRSAPSFSGSLHGRAASGNRRAVDAMLEQVKAFAHSLPPLLSPVKSTEKSMEELLWDELDNDTDPVYGRGEEREEGEMWAGDESD